MTLLHLSTLGQCLVSLARQGIKEPLYRVLRFVDSGATVSKSKRPISEEIQKGDLNNSQCQKSNLCPIQINQLRVSLKRSTAILYQINQIQQSPDPQVLPKQQSLKNIVYPPNYSTEEQCKEIQNIVQQVSELENYLKAQVTLVTGYLEQIKNYQINQEYLQQVQEEEKFLNMPQVQCQIKHSDLDSQGQTVQFYKLHEDIFNNVSNLNHPKHIFEIMKKFDLSYFEADKCFWLNKRDLSQLNIFIKKIFIFNIKKLEKFGKIQQKIINPPL